MISGEWLWEWWKWWNLLLASQKFEEQYSSDGELLQHENLIALPKGGEGIYGDPVEVVSRDTNL